MGHCIRVFVLKKEQAKIDLSKQVHVECPQGFILLPGPWEEGDERKPEKVAERISAGPVAYLTTDYFGGMGDQRASLFDPIAKPGTAYELHCDSINEVLVKMGLVKKDNMDEFDTLGLGRYRDMQDFYLKEKEEEEILHISISS